MKIVIVGGVAGGANVAARARRLSEDAAIVLLERGPHVSFANCGLPYHIGGEISDRKKLLVHTPQSLAERFSIDVRVRSEVTAIDRQRKVVAVQNLETGAKYEERYDALVLGTGAAPLFPPLPGLNRPGLFTLRDIPDMDRIEEWLTEHPRARAAVVGGGFIGLEMAEQLSRRGCAVTIVEGSPQLLPPLDADMASLVEAELRRQGVTVHLSAPVEGFSDGEPGEPAAAGIVLAKGQVRVPADIILFGIGVRPETNLARSAGLALGPTGGIIVDEQLRTSAADIWAVGDCIETKNMVTGKTGVVPLAGPANRQGRLVADLLFGRETSYRGTLGTSVVRVFDYTAACTGPNERRLAIDGIPYRVVHVHPSSHASYYPGAEPIALKLLFAPDSGRVLGAQAVGKDGVEKRIDVLATAIAAGMTVEDLTHLELCYAPPVGSAKDPINLAGMAAENILRGLVRSETWQLFSRRTGHSFLLDVRDHSEWQRGHVPGAHHIPLPELRGRLNELPRDRELFVYCQSGQRSYIACRILAQHGFAATNLSGAYRSWLATPGMAQAS